MEKNDIDKSREVAEEFFRSGMEFSKLGKFVKGKKLLQKSLHLYVLI